MLHPANADLEHYHTECSALRNESVKFQQNGNGPSSLSIPLVVDFVAAIPTTVNRSPRDGDSVGSGCSTGEEGSQDHCFCCNPRRFWFGVSFFGVWLNLGAV